MNLFNSCHLRLIDLRRPWPPMPERRPGSSGRLFVTLICLLWFGALSIRAAEYYVATNGAGGDYQSWGQAASNIQWAVNAAAAGETIWVSNGTYNLTNQITLDNRKILRSTNGMNYTFVNGSYPAYTNRCFHISGTGILDGFTVSNGHNMVSNDYAGGGGAFLSNGTIRNCYFARNVCSNGGNYSGGGGVCIAGNGTITNCTFFTNVCLKPSGTGSGNNGGAIKAYGIGTVYITGCWISNNFAVNEAGIRCGEPGSSITGLVSNCTFSANNGGDYNAAIYLYSGSIMTDCIISNNTTQYGAVTLYGAAQNCVIVKNTATSTAWGPVITMGNPGKLSNCVVYANSGKSAVEVVGAANIVIEQSEFYNNIGQDVWGAGAISVTNNVTLRNCLIHHNTNTAGNGGAVNLLGNTAVNRAVGGVFNCTIVSNNCIASATEGGGICAIGPSNYIVNCIIAGNRSAGGSYPDIYNKDNVSSNNYYYCRTGTNSLLFAPNQGNITNDPLFTGAGNWRLNANSPCINTGTNQSWMTNSYDLDGRTRIRYGTVDMGAYERINEGTIYKLW